MTPIFFPQCNKIFRPPDGMEESQVGSVHCHVRLVLCGSCDGLPQIVIAYKPTVEDLRRINEGGLIYLSVIGDALPPHYLSTTFHDATHPA